MSSGELEGITLYSDKRFNWVISSAVDTTTSSTNCAYDRFVLTDGVMGEYGGDAAPFRYDTAYGLTSEETLDVSDHYPIALSLSTSSSKKISIYTSPMLLDTINNEWGRDLIKEGSELGAAVIIGRFPLTLPDITLNNTPDMNGSEIRLNITEYLMNGGGGVAMGTKVVNGRYVLSLDLITIGSWDGSSSPLGPDRFLLFLSNPSSSSSPSPSPSRVLFNQTFCAVPMGVQSYPPHEGDNDNDNDEGKECGSGSIAHNTLKYIDPSTGEVNDYTYRIEVEFDYNGEEEGEDLTITFATRSEGEYESLFFESWAITNLALDLLVDPSQPTNNIIPNQDNIPFPFLDKMGFGDGKFSFSNNLVTLVIDIDILPLFDGENNNINNNNMEELVGAAVLLQIISLTNDSEDDLLPVTLISSQSLSISTLQLTFTLPARSFYILSYLISSDDFHVQNTYLYRAVLSLDSLDQ